LNYFQSIKGKKKEEGEVLHHNPKRGKKNAKVHWKKTLESRQKGKEGPASKPRTSPERKEKKRQKRFNWPKSNPLP